jgi:small subunit ribosomal protein S6
MVERYRSMIEASGGNIHRLEDWGRRQLAHSINKVHKAHYMLMNIECDAGIRDELVGAFKFNDAVLRHLVIARDEAVTDASPMAKDPEEEEKGERRKVADAPAAVAPVAVAPAAEGDVESAPQAEAETQASAEADAGVAAEPEGADSAEADTGVAAEPEVADSTEAEASEPASEDGRDDAAEVKTDDAA